jgi:hypothetical protein
MFHIHEKMFQVYDKLFLLNRGLFQNKESDLKMIVQSYSGETNIRNS